MRSSFEITVSNVRELLSYDPETGVLAWNTLDRAWFANNQSYLAWNTKYAGNAAGAYQPKKDSRGYFHLQFRRKFYMVHRLIWMLVYGETPDVIDHINGNGADNRLSNLRNVSEQGNHRNRAIQRNNKSGAHGVIKRQGKYVAVITVDKRQKYLGTFDSFEEARARRKEAEFAYGFHPNHGERLSKRCLS